jgi:LemA protein
MVTTLTVGLIAGAVTVGLIGVWAVSKYNGLVASKNEVENTWSDIDIVLQQRQDEIPNLIKVVREYADHEKSVFKDVSEKRQMLREAETPKEKADANQALTGVLSNLFAIAEDYPDLKANENYQELQQRISTMENKIAQSRTEYNTAATQYNTEQDQFPGNIVANMMGLEQKELFEANREELTAENAYSSL